MAAACNRFYCAQSSLLQTGHHVTARRITQLTGISYRNVNPWCHHAGDGCGWFKEITYCTFDTSAWSSPWMRRKWNEGRREFTPTAFMRGPRQKCCKIQWKQEKKSVTKPSNYKQKGPVCRFLSRRHSLTHFSSWKQRFCDWRDTVEFYFPPLKVLLRVRWQILIWLQM